MKLVLHLELDEKDLLFYNRDKYSSKSKLKSDLESSMDVWLITLESGSRYYKFIEDEREKDRED